MTDAAKKPAIRILIIGDVERSEFRESVAALEDCGIVETAADVESAMAALAGGPAAPLAVVVAQSYPGQFASREIDRLRNAAPLAQVFGLMGTWCEGEMRTGQPWPASSRLYWHQWAARCRRQFDRMARGKSCSFLLPPTATEEERMLADEGVRQNRVDSIMDTCRTSPQRGLAVVRCRSFDSWETLSTACRMYGMSAVWMRDETVRVAGATAGIFDCDRSTDEEFDALRRAVKTLRPAPVIALASFPRVDDRRRAIDAGAAEVVSKPLIWDDLFAAISRQITLFRCTPAETFKSAAT